MTIAASATPVLDVIAPGPLAQFQDAGRYGVAHLGMTTAGAIDNDAYYWANRLCSNAEGATVIEIAFGGFKACALARCSIAITGCSLNVMVNGKRVSQWVSTHLKPGDLLTLDYSKNGARAYLAIAGGFASPELFNSASTCSREDLLPPIAASQTLYANTSSTACIEQALSRSDFSQLGATYGEQSLPDTLGIVINTNNTQWSPTEQTQLEEQLTNQCFNVSPQSDRMGIRLTSSAVIKMPSQTVLSEGMVTGTVQLPPSGQPIIMMHDHQTIGGYPKIGYLMETHWPKVAQLTPGNQVRFEVVTLEQAIAALKHRQEQRNTVALHPIRRW
ncbi:KipI antagonist [BD1-7 clade bacterium]|uniref:KipI antagonist n=1 Tax=BD1-7 clade bacterium TaxID=2029982 RepID=A0A5S9Q7L7_9GAMM|nr:KipI antagonist [BD1-7 clade bacterium]CAA0114900.1 KipI antagonist [BD1-7 clade bacterium]